MNFRFDDSSTQNEQNLLLQPLSLCRELGKGCARFHVHRGYHLYLRPNYLRRVLPVLPIILANSCFLLASCSRLQVCNHNYCVFFFCFFFCCCFFFYVSFPLKGRDFEANETYIFQNMWSTSFDVLFHCICLGCYLVFSYLSLNAQRSSIIQNLKR